MKSTTKSFSKILCGILVVLFMTGFQLRPMAQITVYQYRHVPDDKINEFIFKETNYWSKVAQKAIDNKKMTFWALLEKMGGYDLPNSSNFLFINTFPDLDAVGRGEVFNASAVFPDVPISQMETNSISTTTSNFYLHDEGFAMDAKAVPEKDFNYVVMVYHNTNYADSLIKLEKQYWAPFIQKAMDNDQTPQVGWGNTAVLAPLGDNIKFTTVSYDLYKTLQEALMPKWDPKTVFPTKGLDMINKLELNRRGISVYRVVKVASAPN